MPGSAALTHPLITSPQLWLRPLPHDVAAALPALHDAAPAEAQPGDVPVGGATIDLSALAVLGALEGWHSLWDERGRARGQVKVEVRRWRASKDGNPAMY
jgi:hypothetical protein